MSSVRWITRIAQANEDFEDCDLRAELARRAAEKHYGQPTEEELARNLDPVQPTNFKQHLFYPALALEYGVNAALIAFGMTDRLLRVQAAGKADGKFIIKEDGHYWLRMSGRNLQRDLPYMTHKKLCTGLAKLSTVKPYTDDLWFVCRVGSGSDRTSYYRLFNPKRARKLHADREARHRLYVEEAQQHGVTGAIVLQRLVHWIDHNQAIAKEGDCDGNGHWWLWQSAADICREQPYLAERTVDRVLTKFMAQGVLIRQYHGKDRRKNKPAWRLSGETPVFDKLRPKTLDEQDDLLPSQNSVKRDNGDAKRDNGDAKRDNGDAKRDNGITDHILDNKELQSSNQGFIDNYHRQKCSARFARSTPVEDNSATSHNESASLRSASSVDSLPAAGALANARGTDPESEKHQPIERRLIPPPARKQVIYEDDLEEELIHDPQPQSKRVTSPPAAKLKVQEKPDQEEFGTIQPGWNQEDVEQLKHMLTEHKRLRMSSPGEMKEKLKRSKAAQDPNVYHHPGIRM